MRGKIGFYIGFWIFCICCLFSCQTTSKESIKTLDTIKSGKKQDTILYQSKDMAISINYGFCGLIQKNESLPVKVKFSAKKDWAGTIKISIPVSSDKEASYEQKVDIKKGESVENLSIANIENAYYFDICIEDAESEKLVETRVETGITDENKLYMGVLSEKEEGVSYFDGLKKQKDEDEANIVQIKLEASEIPDDVEAFSALDYLLVNQFSVDTLSKKQKKAIQNWVKQGGVLIIGTGGTKTDSLGQLWNVVATTKSNKKEKVLFSLDWAGDKENIIINHVSVEVKKGFTFDSLLDRELLKKISYGDGFFCISEIDLSDPLIEKHKEKIGKIILEQTTTKRFYSLMKDKGGVVQNLTQALNFGDGEMTPNIFLYIGLFFVYIGLIGPTSYFILKHFDRKTWFFIVILVLSCLFTALVFLGSSDYQKKKPTMSILVLENPQKEKDVVYVSVQNFKRKKYQLTLPSETDSVEMIPDLSALYDLSDLYKLGDKETEYKIKKNKKAFTIDFLEKSILSQNILKLTKKTKKKTGSFQYKLKVDTGSISGEVKNETGYDFSYVLFYYQKRYWIVKDLKKNQSAQIEASDVHLIDLTQNEIGYFLTKSVYPVKTQAEYRQLNETQKIFAFLYANILKENEEDKGYFIGVTSEMEDAILKNEELNVKQKLSYIQPVSKTDMEGNKGSELLDSYLQKVEGQMYGSVLYSDSVTISYQIEDLKQIESFVRLDDYYDGEIYIYDYEKKRYKKVLEEGQDKITKDEMKNYIDGEGKLQILLKTQEDYTQLPVIVITK